MNIPKYVNIASDNTLVRDTFSKGIINTNTNALQVSLKKHALAMEKLADQRRKDTELNTLRSEIADLKNMVTKLLENKSECPS
jgi:hypothetical protein